MGSWSNPLHECTNVTEEECGNATLALIMPRKKNKMSPRLKCHRGLVAKQAMLFYVILFSLGLYTGLITSIQVPCKSASNIFGP